MGGFGKGRGSPLTNGDGTYGYSWSGSNNQTQRWGQNKLDGTGTASDSYTSYVITADFNGPNEPCVPPYESAIAEWDSGGGWFIHYGGKWKVAGLSRGVQHLGESWFSPPDSIDAVRISSYATWISQTIPERVQGDLTGDDCVDFSDIAVFASYWQDTGCEYPDWCAGADSEPDGDVDWADLAYLVDNWLNCG